MEQQEKKLSAGKPPDGAKLSFKEKMKLFAQEVNIIACYFDKLLTEKIFSGWRVHAQR